MSVELKSLIQRLNPISRKALELGAQGCVRQTNYNVEIEHILRAILELGSTDFHILLRYYEVDEQAVLDELTAAIEGFKRGNSRTPAFSLHVLRLLEAAWTTTSLTLGEETVRTGALLLALLEDDLLRAHVVQESAPSLDRIKRDHLRENLVDLVRKSSENEDGTSDDGADPSAPDADHAPPHAERPAARTLRGNSALDRFTVDLTAAAEQGKLDPVRGRDVEVRQVIDILMRRRQNNPILTGEAGVGKTAVVEGFAMRISAGEIPEALSTARVLSLDLGLLQAGAGLKGEFEERLKSVIEEVKASEQPTIVFIDEAHTLIGAGGPEGGGDAANLLKPALARGELRTIAATTWTEYKRYVEKDSALARRFQVVKVDEPTPEVAIDMLRGVADELSVHHGVRILDEAVRDAVELSHRYLPGRRLPDKAVSLLDTACARVSIGQSSVPSAVEAARREVNRVSLELGIARKEGLRTGENELVIADLERVLDAASKQVELLDARWDAERELAEQMIPLHAALDEAGEKGLKPDEVPATRSELRELEDLLSHLQGESPLVAIEVDSNVVATVLADWTGIPVGKMVRSEIKAVMNLRTRLADRIIGQPEALDIISRRVGTSSAGLEDPEKPTGVFLLVGPSGVGKTETATTVADFLYGGERNMITVNMSEYQEAHTVSQLKGAPPGYVGYGTGGVLTEAVRRRPHSVVLLDEVEKAHPDVLEIFYQVFDKGVMEDGEGQLIDFKNTLIFLTSNVGWDRVMDACSDGGRPDAAALVEHIRPALIQHFPAAFLGRFVTVPYYPLSDADLREIVTLKLAEIQQRFWEQHKADLTYSDSVVQAIVSRCTEVQSGARNIDFIITQTILPDLSDRVLERMAAELQIESIHVSTDDTGQIEFHVGDKATPS
jgi:type VI secretion system protein VasG